MQEKMVDYRLDRSSLLINLGGGVIGDMGGFCASTFKRGMDFIQIPTSLLSMVDASVGGKLGVDFEGLKNLVGLFKNPQLVIVQTGFLDTLPQREWKSGYAEMIKHWLIADLAAWNTYVAVDNWRENIDERSIINSIKVKKGIVEKDPKEYGLRKALNFGHTIGHAVETVSMKKDDDPLNHGESIAIGMICEAYLSHKHSDLSIDEFEQVVDYIMDIYPHRVLEESEWEELLEVMQSDKKNVSEQIRFTLIPQIGRVLFDQTLKEDQIKQAFLFYNALEKNKATPME